MTWTNQLLHERARQMKHAVLTGGPLSKNAMLEILDGVLECCPNTLVVPPGAGHTNVSHNHTPACWRQDMLDQ